MSLRQAIVELLFILVPTWILWGLHSTTRKRDF